MANNSFVTLPTAADLLASRGLNPGGRVQQAVDREVVSRLEPYMPKLSGAMIGGMYAATQMGSGRVTIPAPYAALRNREARQNGLRGPFYIQRMKADHMGSILQAAAKAAGGRVK